MLLDGKRINPRPWKRKISDAKAALDDDTAWTGLKQKHSASDDTTSAQMKKKRCGFMGSSRQLIG